MKVKLVKKIKKNTLLEKEVDRNELKMCHARHTDFDFAVCAYEDLHDDLDKEQKVEDQVSHEILFRGRRVDNGEWVKGCYGLRPYPFSKEFYGLSSDIVRTLKPYISDSSSLGGYFVDPETVGQFTGLYDKNGNMVFEGDLLSLATGRTCEVMFADGSFYMNGTGISIHHAGRFTIVGNRWDNPELIWR